MRWPLICFLLAVPSQTDRWSAVGGVLLHPCLLRISLLCLWCVRALGLPEEYVFIPVEASYIEASCYGVRCVACVHPGGVRVDPCGGFIHRDVVLSA